MTIPSNSLPCTVLLTLQCSRMEYYNTFPFDVVALVRDQVVAKERFNSDHETRILQIDLSRNTLDTTIILQSSACFIPAQKLASNDTRHLSVLLTKHEIRRGSQYSAPPDKNAPLRELQNNWDTLGKVDPLWAILSDPAKKNNRWDPAEFFKSGEAVIAQSVQEARGFQPAMRSRRALDFGCGVGRLTQALCAFFEACDGVDIAPSMVQQAIDYNRFGGRCHYHLNSASDLKLFADATFDFIFSMIVLQHIRPEFSRVYIREFVRVLAPGGVMVFQIPGDNHPLNTGIRQSPDILFDSLLILSQPERLIEMHGLPQEEVANIIHSAGGRVLLARADSLAGPRTDSFTYFATKPGLAAP